MKRKTSSASEKHAKAKIEEFGNCSSYADLPLDIITKIMLTLPIESILICKCVCNNWKAVISDSHFAKLHLQHSHVRYMMRTSEYGKLASRALYLLPEISEIECNNHFKLEPSFKLPLWNGKSVFENLKYESKHSSLCEQNYIKFEIVNSCNGLLCLANPSLEGRFKPPIEGRFKLPIVICNPVTGEFITLPEPPYNKAEKQVRFGFGFEPKTNEYKVMKQVRFGFGFEPKTNEYKVMKMWRKYPKLESSLFIEIYTLGTPTWRNIEVDPEAAELVLTPNFHWPFDFLTCVNGTLHWIGFTTASIIKKSILCFNLESERLQSFPSPPDENNEIDGMGELRGFLYVCCYTFGFSNKATIMWVMKKYGDGESWTKAYSFDTLSTPMRIPNPWHSLCFPVKHPEEGTVAAAMSIYHCLITYYVPEKFGFKVFGLVGTERVRFEWIRHIPSLVSLKDIVKGDNIEVISIHSRYAKVKLEEENEVIPMELFNFLA